MSQFEKRDFCDTIIIPKNTKTEIVNGKFESETSKNFKE